MELKDRSNCCSTATETQKLSSPSPGIMDEEYLKMELVLPRDGEGLLLARVKKRLKDANGLPVGVANKNPILDT